MTSLLGGFGVSLSPSSYIPSRYSTNPKSTTTIASVLATAGAVLPLTSSQRIKMKKYLVRVASFSVSSGEVNVSEDGVSQGNGKTVLVAVKKFREEVIKSEVARECAKRELQLLTHPFLSGHPNIVQALGYGWTPKSKEGIENGGGGGRGGGLMDNATPFLLVELADLGALRDFLQSQKLTKTKQGIRELAMLLVDLAQGLLALHESQIIQGDVKLDNALVFSLPAGNQEGLRFRAKLSDFGSAIFENECDSRPYLGTERYNPNFFIPETEKVEELAELYYKTDVYSYGICVWEGFKDGYCYVEEDDVNEFIRECYEFEGGMDNHSDAFLEELREELGEEGEGLIDESYLEKVRKVFWATLNKEFWKRKSMKEVLDLVIALEKVEDDVPKPVAPKAESTVLAAENLSKNNSIEVPKTKGFAAISVQKESKASTSSASSKTVDVPVVPAEKTSKAIPSGSAAQIKSEAKTEFYRNYLRLPAIIQGSNTTIQFQRPDRSVRQFRWRPKTDKEPTQHLENVKAFRCTVKPQANAPDAAIEKAGDFDFFASQAHVAWELQEMIFKQLEKDSKEDDGKVSSRAFLHLAHCYQLGFGTEPNSKKVFRTLENAAEEDWLAEALLANLTYAAEEASEGEPLGDRLIRRLREAQKAKVEHEMILPFTSQGKTYSFSNMSGVYSLLQTYKNLPSYEEQDILSPIVIKLQISEGREESRTLFQHVARLGMLSMHHRLIHRMATNSHLTPYFEETPPAAVYAMEFGHYKDAYFLVDYAEYSCDNRGVTPLHWLWMFEEKECRKLAELIVLGPESIRHMAYDGYLRLDARSGYDSHGQKYERVEPVNFEEFGLKLVGGPIHWATRVGCKHAVEVLLDLGANIDLEFDGIRALDIAVAFHIPELVDLLLTRRAKFENSEGNSALHNITKVIGNTPFARLILHGTEKAVRAAFKSTLQILKKHKLPIRPINKTERTPIMTAMSVGLLDFDVYILEEIATLDPTWHEAESWPTTPLISACVSLRQFKTNLETLRFVLENEKSVGPNAVDEFGLTGLHYAVVANCPEAIEMIVSSSSEVDINMPTIHEDHLQQTPIQLAATFGSKESVETLIRLGAKLQGPNCQWSVLEAAIMNRHREIVEMLLEEGVSLYFDKDEKGGYNTTALHMATSNNTSSTSLVGYLLELSDDYPKIKELVNVVDSAGWTPLHRAAYFGDLEGVENLLAHDAVQKAVLYKDGSDGWKGQIPLEMAVEILKKGPGDDHVKRVETESMRKEFMGRVGEIKVLLEQALE